MRSSQSATLRSSRGGSASQAQQGKHEEASPLVEVYGVLLLIYTTIHFHGWFFMFYPNLLYQIQPKYINEVNEH